MIYDHNDHDPDDNHDGDDDHHHYNLGDNADDINKDVDYSNCKQVRPWKLVRD